MLCTISLCTGLKNGIILIYKAARERYDWYWEIKVEYRQKSRNLQFTVYNLQLLDPSIQICHGDGLILTVCDQSTIFLIDIHSVNWKNIHVSCYDEYSSFLRARARAKRIEVEHRISTLKFLPVQWWSITQWPLTFTQRIGKYVIPTYLYAIFSRKFLPFYRSCEIAFQFVLK